MHKMKQVQYIIHSRSYSFLFTLTIAFIAILTTNLTFEILHSYHNQCAHKTMKRFSTTASSKPQKAFQNHAQAALDVSAID